MRTRAASPWLCASACCWVIAKANGANRYLARRFDLVAVSHGGGCHVGNLCVLCRVGGRHVGHLFVLRGAGFAQGTQGVAHVDPIEDHGALPSGRCDDQRARVFAQLHLGSSCGGIGEARGRRHAEGEGKGEAAGGGGGWGRGHRGTLFYQRRNIKKKQRLAHEPLSWPPQLVLPPSSNQ